MHAAAGGVGGIAVHLAKLAGARVVAIASSEGKLAEAKALGADATFLADPASLAEQVRHATDGAGCDVVIDGVGGPLFGPSSLHSAAMAVTSSWELPASNPRNWTRVG